MAHHSATDAMDAIRQVHLKYFNAGEASLHPKCGSLPKGYASCCIRDSAAERWFVARVLAHQENGEQFNLYRLGFQSFVPRLRRTVRHARRLQDTLQLLFPAICSLSSNLSRTSLA